MSSYCQYISGLSAENVHYKYHNTTYGFPLKDDDELFCRLMLEINQAGLSWDIILKKEANFRKAFKNFKIKKVAHFTQEDIQELLQNKGIIRNKLKIKAAIENANKILELQKKYGSFKEFLDYYHPLTLKEWTKIFKKNFYFTGGEIVNEFLMSTSYLPGAHSKDCPIYEKIIKAQPAWLRTASYRQIKNI